jgi:hypothetical protein
MAEIEDYGEPNYYVADRPTKVDNIAIRTVVGFHRIPKQRWEEIFGPSESAGSDSGEDRQQARPA